MERAFKPATTAFGPACSCARLKRHARSKAVIAGLKARSTETLEYSILLGLKRSDVLPKVQHTEFGRRPILQRLRNAHVARLFPLRREPSARSALL